MAVGNFNEAIPSFWRIGRAFCPTCLTVRAYVKHADVGALHCKDCGTLCLPASGDEAERRPDR